MHMFTVCLDTFTDANTFMFHCPVFWFVPVECGMFQLWCSRMTASVTYPLFIPLGKRRFASPRSLRYRSAKAYFSGISSSSKLVVVTVEVVFVVVVVVVVVVVAAAAVVVAVVEG